MAETRLSAGEMAAHLDIVEYALYDWIANKKLPTHPFGRPLKSLVSKIGEWLPGATPDTKPVIGAA